jgi:hypothetical protein
MSDLVLNNTTANDYYIGPYHLTPSPGTVTIDTTTEQSLYLTDDGFADAINNLVISGKATVQGGTGPTLFPRPTGVPQVLHGDGAPEGLVYAPQGSLYMRRDGAGPNSLYTKTTGLTVSTGWTLFTTGSLGTVYRKTTAKAATNTITETDLLNGEIQLPASALGSNGLMRLTAWGDGVYTSGGNQPAPRFKFKVGSGPTIVIDTGTTGGNVVPTSATRCGWRIVVEWMNLGATNSQWATINGFITTTSGLSAANAAFATGEGIYANTGQAILLFDGSAASSIDTTVAQAIILSVINGSATSTEVKLFGAIVEII